MLPGLFIITSDCRCHPSHKHPFFFTIAHQLPWQCPVNMQCAVWQQASIEPKWQLCGLNVAPYVSPSKGKAAWVLPPTLGFGEGTSGGGERRLGEMGECDSGENQNHPGWQRRKSEKWMMMPEEESKADRECNDLSLSVTSHLTPHS